MRLNKLALMGASISLVWMSTPAAAEGPYQLTLAGGAPKGVWSLIGKGINDAHAAQYPGSSVTYQASAGGGIANIPLVVENKVPMALATDAAVERAVAGKNPFRKKYSKLRGLAFIAGWLPMHMIVTKSFADKYNLKNFADIARAKPPIRVTVNRRSNMAAHISLQMFKEIGVTPKDIKSWGGIVVYQPSPGQRDLMLDRRVDMVSNQLPLKHRVIRQMQKSLDLTLLHIDRPLAVKSAKIFGLKLYKIPQGTYTWQTSEMTAPSLGSTLVTGADLDSKTAYAITKALVEKIGKIHGAHRFLRQLTKEYLASLKIVRYHPGAVKYYKEAGLM